MSTYAQELKAMTDDQLSAEWVRAMTVPIDRGDRRAQLAVIEEVAAEVNTRYEKAQFSSLVITAADAITVSEHMKKLIKADEVGWFDETAPAG